jgi:hypothetical protein
MEGYASGLRQHRQMEYIASKLSAGGRQAVSAYYAAMPFEPGAMPESPAPVLWLAGLPGNSAVLRELGVLPQPSERITRDDLPLSSDGH